MKNVGNVVSYEDFNERVMDIRKSMRDQHAHTFKYSLLDVIASLDGFSVFVNSDESTELYDVRETLVRIIGYIDEKYFSDRSVH